MSWPSTDWELEIENELKALREVAKTARAFLAAWGAQAVASPPPDNVLDGSAALRAALDKVPDPST